MCKYCKETDCINHVCYEVGDENIKSVESLVRLDIREEDNLYQLDTELLVHMNNSQKREIIKGAWSDGLDINYCPMCGRSLRSPYTVRIKNNDNSIPCKDINEIYDAIMTEYKNSDVCIGEVLSEISIDGLSVQHQIDLFARIMHNIEGDILIQANLDEDFCIKRGNF